MPENPSTEQLDVGESVWVEIIRKMESLYAQLADSQAEIERSARELGDAKELLDNVVQSMNDVLIALDSSGTINLVNDAAERLFGFRREELIGKGMECLVPACAGHQWDWAHLSRRIRGAQTRREVETRWQDSHGTLIPVGVGVSALRNRWGELVGAVLVVRDLRESKRRMAEARAATAAARAKARELQRANAELRQLQQELIQAAKMSSLGRLAAGVAHELNNPLGAIMLYADMALEDMPVADERRPFIEKIAEQTARCRRIVSDLLQFARPAEGVARPTDVNSVLEEALSILAGQQIFHNVTVVKELNENLPVLRADRDQLRQAFVNIILNAVEAMEGTGRLTLHSEPGEDGRSVRVSISDSGCGIAREDLEHLFEPFFTRKEDGTGLGLTITYGIVERHGGSIEVESEVGMGTTMRIALRSMSGAAIGQE